MGGLWARCSWMSEYAYITGIRSRRQDEQASSRCPASRHRMPLDDVPTRQTDAAHSTYLSRSGNLKRKKFADLQRAGATSRSWSAKSNNRQLKSLLKSPDSAARPRVNTAYTTGPT